MKSEQLNQNEQYFLQLLACSLQKKTPIPVPEDVIAEEVGKLAKRQNLLHIIYEIAEEAGCLPEGEKAIRWKDEYVRNKVRDLRQQIAFDDIAEILNANAIRFMPLKGLNLKPLYPQSYLRRMTDLDILVKPEDLDRAFEVLSKNGFVPGSKGIIHYNLKKSPSVNVELHRFLFQEEKLQALFYSIWDNAEQNGVYEYGYNIATRDLVAHVIIHYAQHFCREGGVGVRAVMDFHILRKTFPGIIDSNALRKLLDSAGVLTFYEVISRIGEIWFEQRTFEDSYEDIQKYLLYSTGNYGNEKTLAIQ